MTSSYKNIGDYIDKVNNRNTDLKTTNLLGINIDKFFMPSVANVVGTDMSNYKVVKKGQFACNRMHVGRDYRIPVSLSDIEEDFLVSPAYDVFEVKDPDVLLPEYLMMWFSRAEYDRNAWFYTDADVRGGLHWDAFCKIGIPVPSIDKQKEIVKEYSILVDRVNLNSNLIHKLEETAQAVYKQWFVDFEFPNEYGKPYKSSGGEMIYNPEIDLEIPKDWSVESVFEMTSVQYGYPFDSNLFCSDESQKPLIRIRDILSNISETYTSESVNEIYKIKQNDIVIGMDGQFHISLWFGAEAWQNQRIVRLRCDKENNFAPLQLLYSIQQPIKRLEGKMEGTTVAHLSDKDMKGLQIVVGSKNIQDKIYQILSKVGKFKIEISQENVKLQNMAQVLLSKIANI